MTNDTTTTNATNDATNTNANDARYDVIMTIRDRVRVRISNGRAIVKGVIASNMTLNDANALRYALINAQRERRAIVASRNANVA